MAQWLVKAIIYLLIAMMALLVALVAFYWAPDRSVAELKQWQLPNSEFIDVQGMQAHVVRSDKCDVYRSQTTIDKAVNTGASLPEALVLLHGTSASLHTWQGWTKALSANYCVVSMDLPGFGLTGPYTDATTKYSSANYAKFVMQVLDHLNLNQVTKVTLAGNSLGGKVAWRTAALYPERIDKLILVDAVGYPATPKQVPMGFKLAKYPALTPILTRILPRDVVKKSVLSVYADDSKVDEALVDRYYDLTLRQGNRQALNRRLQETDSTSNQAQIKKLNLPTLIIWGVQDDLIPVENATLFHKDIANSQLKIFDNLGHVPHEEDPIATVNVVKDFLAQTE
ncbi:alpha/beta fold hydrolase [Psychrobacter sp. AOP22-C1-22]|uniref:alpha/beta fold hydrolase n=1 Tax=unclassified Psychrobacter TaxID=196806 RepID=UPI001CE42BFC|nr:MULTISPECIES: alpha/beta hydrolase [unclassified Psychrobacter]MDN5801418.1 alpha/beta hydrolase [Psychrobacter sp.]